MDDRRETHGICPDCHDELQNREVCAIHVKPRPCEDCKDEMTDRVYQTQKEAPHER